GVLLQHLFDLLGVDLLAAAVDARRSPAEQLYRPVVADAHVVTWYRIALPVDGGEHPGAAVRITVVAQGDGAAHGDAADQAGLGRRYLIVVVEDHRARPGGEAGSRQEVAVRGQVHAEPPGLAHPAGGAD